jgi:hypothetical protein
VTTSGLTTWTLNIDEVVREAFEQVGGEPTLGEEARSARRSLNLLLTEWQNRNILLWRMQQYTVTAVSGTSTYTLTQPEIDILDMINVRSSVAIPMDRMSMAEYLEIPRKDQVGRSFRYFMDRQRTSVTFTAWPTPDNSTDRFTYWAIRRHENFDKAVDDPDVPHRFLPALCAGLAYRIALKRPGIPETRIALLKMNYEEQLSFANEEDRERASLLVVPDIPSVL